MLRLDTLQVDVVVWNFVGPDTLHPCIILHQHLVGGGVNQWLEAKLATVTQPGNFCLHGREEGSGGVGPGETCGKESAIND